MDFKLLKENGNFYLVGKRFEVLSTAQQVHTAAQETIADINLSFHFACYDFTNVSFDNRIEEWRAGGSNLTYQWMAPETGRFKFKGGNAILHYPGELMPPQPSFPERVIRAFGVNENFRGAVKAFNAEPKNHTVLYIAYEAVRRGVSPSNDYKALVDRGWAKPDELNRFHDTAKWHRHGPPREPMKFPELPLNEAVEIVQRLLAKWAKELS